MIKNKIYNTYPCIAHNPIIEIPNRHWDLCVNQKARSGFNLPEDLDLITWNNSKDLGLLEKNLLSLNLPHIRLGLGIENWLNRHKISLTYNFVCNSKKEYTLAVDCYDALFIGNPRNIVTEFLSYDTDVLFNATTSSWPDCPELRVKEESLCQDFPFRYLNSGAFIGKTKYLKTFLEKVIECENNCTKVHIDDDQIKYKSVYLESYPRVKLDSQCKIFQVMFVNPNTNLSFDDVVKIEQYRI